MEDPDVTLDIPNFGVDPKAVERVTSWQAIPTPPSSAPHRLPFSSSLPPSSPLPPFPQDIFLEDSEFIPPSPQQEGNFLEADMSYESNITDEFGFFAAQGRIHAKMDREHTLNADGLGARRRHSTIEANTTLEQSFSGRPAFATPYIRRHPTDSSHDTEDAAPMKQAQSEASDEESSSPEPRAQRRRVRSRRQKRGRRSHGGTGASRRTRVAPGRVKKAALPSTKPLGNVSSKASRKVSGSRAGHSRIMRMAYVSINNGGNDTDGTDSDEEVRIQRSVR